MFVTGSYFFDMKTHVMLRCEYKRSTIQSHLYRTFTLHHTISSTTLIFVIIILQLYASRRSYSYMARIPITTFHPIIHSPQRLIHNKFHRTTQPYQIIFQHENDNENARLDKSLRFIHSIPDNNMNNDINNDNIDNVSTFALPDAMVSVAEIHTNNVSVEVFNTHSDIGDDDDMTIRSSNCNHHDHMDHPTNHNKNNDKNNKNIWWSVVLLNMVAIVWGTQHAVIKGVVVDVIDLTTSISTTTTSLVDSSSSSSSDSSTSPTSMMVPAVFTLLRFTIAAMIASPYTPSLPNSDFHLFPTPTPSTTATVASKTENDSKSGHTMILPVPTNRSNQIWRWGIEMGLYMFLGFSLQAIGLQFTTAQRSGFLLYLNVKFVPFLAYLLYQRPVRTVTLLSALTAFTGTALLAYNPIDDTIASETTTLQQLSHMIRLNVGDVWTMAAAIASAMFILRLETASNELGQDEDDAATAKFNAASLWVVAFLSLVWTLFVAVSESSSSLLLSSYDTGMSELSNALIPVRTEMEHLLRNHLWELVYLGGVTTALANYVQTRAQRFISAERASIIYAMDPVYGAFFAYLILGETFNGITGYIGAALIVIAAATNAFLDTTTKKDESAIDLDTN